MTKEYGTNKLTQHQIDAMSHEQVLNECAKAQYEPYWTKQTWLALLKRSDETAPNNNDVIKDYEVMGCVRVQTRGWIKAESIEEAKNQVRDEFLKHGMSSDMFFLARQIKWLHEKYPRDIGFEAVTEWK